VFSIAEISKTFLTDNFTPLTSWVYSKQVTLTQAEIDASYWVTWGGTIDYNQVNRSISSVYLDYTLNLHEMDNLLDCHAQEESFYFDAVNQILYIHVTHTENPFVQTIETGLLFGYCSDKVRYFGNREYKPILLSIPTISQSADPLQYDIMAFSGGSVVLSNDGEFDTFEKLYGNTIRLKIGKEGDDYTDLVTIFSGYIKDYTTTTKDITIDIGDNREKLQIEYPTQVFDDLTGQAEDSNGKLIPDGYGSVIQVPAYPIAINSGTVTFQWGQSVTSITQVYVEQDDKLTPVAHSGFTNSGLFLLSDANAYKDGDNTKGLRKVYVTGVMRNLTNPADIIVDLNSRLANIQYNSTNYDMTEWETEKASLAGVSLYMDNSKSLYDWISLLQSGSTWGFRYEDSGKRTLRLDDPDRPQITFDDGTTLITPVEIRNSDIPINQNAELYATSCIVKYGYNHRTQSYSQVENTDFKDAILQEHRIEKIITLESLLTSKTDAEEKALRIMQDQSKVRPILTLELEVSKCTTPRIYDIIQAEVSLLTRESRIPSVWSYVLGDMDILGDDLGLIGEVHKLTRTEAYTKNGSRLYFGTLKGQVIGIEPRTDTDSVILKIRERD
jgi:hypothetical protein